MLNKAPTFSLTHILFNLKIASCMIYLLFRTFNLQVPDFGKTI